MKRPVPSSKGEYDIGYAKPPRSNRFAKGKSGNPKGRPRGSRNALPYDAVLGQKVTIREEGVERRVTAAEAFLLHMTKSGLAGNGPAGRAAMAAIEEARARRGPVGGGVTEIVLVSVAPGAVNTALQPLNMAVKLDRFRANCRMLLQPWLVQMALARLGDRRLTLAEQAEVMRATRTPLKVVWPDWWEAAD